MTKKDVYVLRDLAKRVSDIAAHPLQQERKRLWHVHNALKQERIMILCYPEDAWEELLPPECLTTQDPLARTYEWNLRHLIYRWENIKDDYVINAVVNVPLVYKNTGWGLDARRITVDESPENQRECNGLATPFSMAGEFCRVFTGRRHGAYRIEPVLLEEQDLKKMVYPKIITYEAETNSNYEIIADVIGDILPVRINRQVEYNLSLIGTMNSLRGMDRVMLDMIDRPEWLHRVMEFMTRGTFELLKDCEERGLLELNNGCHYVGSGGFGFTDELPVPGYDPGKTVRIKDCWGHATLQSATFLSPEMQYEFVLQYQARLLEGFGLNCFGCCEVLDHLKFNNIKKAVKNLRRVSVSPFTDVRIACEELGDRFVFSWKPNPSYLLADDADYQFIEKYVREAVGICRKCNMEIILKDIISLRREPGRLQKWVEITRRIAET